MQRFPLLETMVPYNLSTRLRRIYIRSSLICVSLRWYVYLIYRSALHFQGGGCVPRLHPRRVE
jgi:hypothetical protein